MEALFFCGSTDAATAVTSSHDLPGDPAADALRVEDPSPMSGLAVLLGAEQTPQPLRDATCRSFPVWEMGTDATLRIASLADDEIDDLAERWQKHNETSLDANAYELAGFLGDLRETLRGDDSGEMLFFLLEERVW